MKFASASYSFIITSLTSQEKYSNRTYAEAPSVPPIWGMLNPISPYLGIQGPKSDSTA